MSVARRATWSRRRSGECYAAEMHLAALLVAAIAVPGSVQQDRTPEHEVVSAGRVVDLAGKPVANATVRFLSRPVPRSMTAGVADRRSVQTDERGRYRLNLHRDHSYSVWASWGDGATRLIEGVAGGEYLELRGAAGTQPFSLELEGLSKWSGSDKFSVRILVGGENFDFAATQRDGDVFRVPALPPHTSRIYEVLDADGEILWANSLGTRREQSVSTLPERKPWAVNVVDEEGAPVAGAVVRWHIRNYWYSASDTLPAGQRFQSRWPVVCRTDAAGEGSFAVPFAGARSSLWLATSKDGYTMSQDGIVSGSRFAAGKPLAREPDDEDAPFHIVLQKSAPMVIDLRDATGAANVDGWACLGLRVNVKQKRGGRGTIMTMSAPVVDGQIKLMAPLPPGTEVELVEVMLSEDYREALRARHGSAPRLWRSLGPTALLANKGGSDPLGLTGVTPVQVTAVDGRPAARVAVMLEDRRRGMVGVRTNRTGKALLGGHARPGSRVVAADDQGFAVGRVEAQGTKLELQLEPFDLAAVRVVDLDGAPVAGVGVQVSSCACDNQDEARSWGLNAVMPFRAMVASDEDGHLQLPVPPTGCRLVLRSSRQIHTGNSMRWDPVASGSSQPGVHTVVVKPAR